MYMYVTHKPCTHVLMHVRKCAYMHHTTLVGHALEDEFVLDHVVQLQEREDVAIEILK